MRFRERVGIHDHEGIRERLVPEDAIDSPAKRMSLSPKAGLVPYQDLSPGPSGELSGLISTVVRDHHHPVQVGWVALTLQGLDTAGDHLSFVVGRNQHGEPMPGDGPRRRRSMK